MALITNCAEGGTDGVQPSSANSGGLSGTALTTQTLSGTGTTLTFSTNAAHGSLGYRHNYAAVSSTAWQLFPGTAAAGRWVFRYYLQVSAVPTVYDYLSKYRSSTAQLAVMTVGTDGKLILQNAAGAGITASRATNALAANTRYRVEVAITPGTTTSNGRLEYAYYLGDSGTAEFTYDSGTTQNAGTTNCRDMRVGRDTAIISALIVDYDDLASNQLASGWIGAAYVASPSGVATAEAFGTATVTVASGGITVSPSGIASVEAFGSATISATLAVAPGGIATAEAFGTAAVSTTLAVSPSGIATSEAFGTAAVTTVLQIAPSGVASDEAFGTAAVLVAQTVSPSGIASGEALGTPAVSATLAVSPTGVFSDETFGAPNVSLTLLVSPAGIASAETFGTPQIVTTGTVAPSGIASGEAFGTPAVSTNLAVSPAGIASAEAPGTPVVTKTLTVSPSGIATAAAFGTATVTLNGLSQTITVTAGIPSLEAFNAPRLSSILVFWPTGIPSQTAFGIPVIGHITRVLPPGITSSEAFGNPTITKTLAVTVQGIVSRQAIGNPRLSGPGLTLLEYELSGSVALSRNRGSLGDPSTTVQTPARWEGSLG